MRGTNQWVTKAVDSDSSTTCVRRFLSPITRTVSRSRASTSCMVR